VTLRTALDLPHGLHDGVPEGVYHQRVPGLVSKGALEEVMRSSAHYEAWLNGHRTKVGAELDLGKAFHCALLEPERFAVDYVVEPAFGDCRKPANKANRDAWREANKGAVWLSDEDHRACAAMAASIRRHSRASKLLVGGRAEVTARWADEETGLECKARTDYYVADRSRIVDVKTARDARELPFSYAARDYGYHRQDALYRAGFAALGAEVEHFVFVVVEKEPPYAVAVYELDEEDVLDGWDEVQKAMRELARAFEEDRWSAYPEEVRTLKLPRRRAA
jgi:PDDEXK-like domain of unknown function (DUF3799)